MTWKGTSYKAGRVSFEKRFDPTWFLTKLTDVLLCWQWDDTSPALEFEALMRGFPLVHNNPRFKVGAARPLPAKQCGVPTCARFPAGVLGLRLLL